MMMMNKHQSLTLQITTAIVIVATILGLSVVVDVVFESTQALKQKNVGSGSSD
jgi:hypothetical protein